MGERSWFAGIGPGWASKPSVEASRRWLTAVSNLVFPPCCAGCGADLAADDPAARLCRECREAFLSRRETLCPRCGAVLHAELANPSGCPRCRGRRLRFEGVVSLGTYQGPLRRAVLQMKRPWGEPLAIAVTHLLCDRVGPELAAADLDAVVPIPMHWTRRLVRGTNSAEVIAEVVGRRLRLPSAQRLLVRRRKTRPQFTLHPGERLRNIRRAFRVSAGYHLDAARLLLVDDILTTGATCNEATKVLLAAGAERVSVAVIARAEGV